GPEQNNVSPDAMREPASAANGSRALVPVTPANGHTNLRANGHAGMIIPAALAVRPNAALLLRALRRRWLFASTMGLLAAATAFAATYFLLPQTYTVQTSLFMASRPPTLMGREVGSDFSTFQRSQAALLKTRFVLNRALRAEAVSQLRVVQEQPDPVDWLETTLQVDFLSEWMRIALVGDNPQELTIVVQSVSDAYLQEV